MTRTIRQYGEFVLTREDRVLDERTLRVLFEARADQWCLDHHAVRGPVTVIQKIADPDSPDPYNHVGSAGFKFYFLVRVGSKNRDEARRLLAHWRQDSTKRITFSKEAA